MNFNVLNTLKVLSILAVINLPIYAGDEHPNFSTDDSQLVYMSDGEIKIVDIATGKVRNLTNSPTADMCPDWSNDGTTIVFDSMRDDANRDLYVMAIDGTNVRRLTKEPDRQDKCPVFSPDDSRVTYICTANGDMDIFVMNSDGKGVKNLTNDPGSDRCPSWTPDGKKITFMSNRTGFFEVYIMDSDDGSNPKQLTELKIKGSNCWVAAVRPDGKKICFVGDFEGNNELYVMDIDGNNVRNLTQHRTDDQWPAWSHDGKWIAFSSDRSGEQLLYVVRPDGSGLRQVTGTGKQVLDKVRKHNFEKNSGYDGVAYLGDNAWRVRTLAIRDLVRLGSEAKLILIAGLNDENRHVRHICVAAIGILGLRDAGNDLVKLLTDDHDPIVRGQAAQTLGQIGYTDAIETLKRAGQQDDSKHVRHRAELAIGRLKENSSNNTELIKAWTNLDERTFRRAETGKPAPDFELKDVYGKTWRLSDFKNKKTVVLLWIFADWCPVCHREFHDLTQMEEQYKQTNIQVFTIECHDQYRCGVMGKGKDLWWPHLVDNAGAVAAMYGADPMEFVVHDEWINRPSTIIVDTEGIVRFTYYGTYWGDRPTIEQTLKMVKTNSYSFRHPERRE
ncbi:MAG: PD40 domain-containing protein [Planctomycetes bacterium]|nr:PD40 domain-containing protein [Planctomycetota bacterium]MCH8120585.1 PD40 domain-containing protein [Planctomycetota bacterium]